MIDGIDRSSEQNAEPVAKKPEVFVAGETDPYRVRFEDRIYEQLYDEEFDFSDKYKEYQDILYENGDLIKDQNFLGKMVEMSPAQRLALLTQSARKVYICPDDFEEYFTVFPEDAKSVIATCLGKIEIGERPEFTIYQLSCKVFEAAAKTIPGYWEAFQTAVADEHHSTRDNQWPTNYLAVSERSKKARSHLLGDYRLLPRHLFEQFGSDLSKKLGNFLDHSEDLRNLKDRGLVNFDIEILNDPNYLKLSATDKVSFLQTVMAYCHNAVVFHEVYNSGLEEKHSVAEPEKITVGMDEEGMWEEKITGRGHHSIIYETDHRENAFQMPEYREFSDGEWLEEEPADQYGYEKIIQSAIQELGRVASKEDISAIMNFWDVNRDPAYGPAIAQTISSLGAAEGVAQILAKLPEAKEVDKRRLVSLLFRLELGRVGISEQGLEYLGRKFDLGEHNSPDYFAHRLTPDGKVGIFDEERRLEGIVQLESGDFQGGDGKENIQKIVLNITAEMLFTPNPDETSEEQALRQQIVQEFKEKYFDTYLGLFSEKSDLRFNNLGLFEQGWVLQYLAQVDEASKETFFQFIAQYGEEGFKAFRSMEFGQEMAQAVLGIAEKTDDKTARIIYSKYAEIVAATEKVRGFITTGFNNDHDFSPEIVDQVVLQLLQKGRDILTKSATNNADSATIEQDLGAVKASVLTFANVFKAMKTGGEQLELQDFRDFQIEIASGTQISETEKMEMVEIFTKNRKDRPDVLKRFLPEFGQALADSGNSFYLLKFQGNLIGYFRLDPEEDGKYYLGSLNISDQLQGKGIGESVLKKVFPEAARSKVVHATADPRIKITQRYVGDLGFVVQGIKDVDGLPYFDMVWDQETNSKYEYINKQLGHVDTAKISPHQTIIRHYNPADYQRLTADCQAICGQDFVLTSYKTDQSSGRLVCIYEKKQPNTEASPAEYPSVNRSPQEDIGLRKAA